MFFLAGTKNTTLYVAVLPHRDIKEEDRTLLIDLMQASGVKNMKMLTLDPREQLGNTAEDFPEARHMAVLPLEQPLIWKCPTCGRSAPRWDEKTGPECCSGETRKDVVLYGLPWEH